MHEYSIVGALLQKAEEEARARGASSVRRLRVRIGELAGVEVDLLITAFETFRDRTLCASADLEIVSAPARWICPGCGEEVRRGAPLRCAGCGVPVRLDGGDEILLERLELEVA